MRYKVSVSFLFISRQGQTQNNMSDITEKHQKVTGNMKFLMGFICWNTIKYCVFCTSLPWTWISIVKYCYMYVKTNSHNFSLQNTAAAAKIKPNLHVCLEISRQKSVERVTISVKMHSSTSYLIPPVVWYEEWGMAAHQRVWRTYESVFPINHHQGRPSVGAGGRSVWCTQVEAEAESSTSHEMNCCHSYLEQPAASHERGILSLFGQTYIQFVWTDF